MSMSKILAAFAALSQCLVTPSELLEANIITNLSQLPRDVNGRLADNWFLFLDTPNCKNAFNDANIISNAKLRKFAAMSKNVSDVFHPDSLSTCNAVSLAIGTNPTFFQHLLPRSKLEIFDEFVNVDEIVPWITGMYHSALCFEN